MNKKFLISLILLMVMTGQMAMDLYLPSFPYMVDYFHTTPDLIKQTLSTYLIGYSLAQLVYGPLSDYFGRRWVLIIGVSIFVCASLACAFAHSISTLLIARGVEGIGAAATNVLYRAILRDKFSGTELQKISSYVGMSWAMVPLLAPLLGGHIQYYFNWQTSFIFLTLFGMALLFVIVVFLKETYKPLASATFNIKNILNDYKTLIKDRIFIGNIICLTLLYGIFICFSIAAPFLLQIELKLSSATYGWVLILSGCGYFFGSYFNSIVCQRYNINKIILSGYAITASCIGIMVVLLFLQSFTLLGVLVPAMGVFFGLGFVYPNSIAASIKPFPHLAGSAGALYGFFIFFGSSMISGMFSFFKDTSPLPLTLVFIILTTLSFLVYKYRVCNNLNNAFKNSEDAIRV